MPALVLCNQQTAVAGDDLRVTSLFGILYRLLQLSVVCPLLVFIKRIDIDQIDFQACAQDSPASIDSGAILYVYWALSILLSCYGLILHLFIFHISGLGSPTQPEKRQKLYLLCCCQLLPLAAFRLATIAVGAVTVYSLSSYCTCRTEATGETRISGAFDINRCPKYGTMSTMFVTLVWTQIIELLFAVAVDAYVIRNIVRPRERLNSIVRYYFSKEREPGSSWKIFCRLFCSCTSLLTCCLFGGRGAVTSDFTDISVALASFFDHGGHLDVTISDILLGLIMLRREQHLKRQEAIEKINDEDNSHHPIVATAADMEAGVGMIENSEASRTGGIAIMKMERDSRGGLEFHDSVRGKLDSSRLDDAHIIEEGAHFMRIAEAIYGYIQYLLSNTISAPCCLVVNGLGLHRLCSQTQVAGDNLCSLNEIAFERMSGLDLDSIVYLSFHVGVTATPYCIVVDQSRRAIVIVIRGTFSLEDAVADVTLRPVPLDEVGQRTGFDGNGAFGHSGMLGCSQWIFDDLKNHGILDRLLSREDSQFKTFKLVVAGHSLGAGCAAILSLMLKPHYPDLKCLCFEPPGCVLSENIAAQDHITSFILDFDIVPRLSLQAVESLRDDILNMIARVRVPKHRVLSYYTARNYKSIADNENEAFLFPPDQIPISTFRQQLEEYHGYYEGVKMNRGFPDVHMTIPGKIVHLVKTPTKSNRLGRYLPVWAHSDDFAEIQLAGSFLSDHFPPNVRAALEEAALRFKEGGEPEKVVAPAVIEESEIRD